MLAGPKAANLTAAWPSPRGRAQLSHRSSAARVDAGYWTKLARLVRYGAASERLYMRHQHRGSGGARRGGELAARRACVRRLSRVPRLLRRRAGLVRAAHRRAHRRLAGSRGSIGHGGMGERSTRAVRALGFHEQRVAIKVLQTEAAAQLERFQAERQILARLEHAGIARPARDGGVVPDGRPFMVDEYVPTACRSPNSVRGAWTRSCGSASRCSSACARQVAYAHRNLVVHRDLEALCHSRSPPGAR